MPRKKTETKKEEKKTTEKKSTRSGCRSKKKV